MHIHCEVRVACPDEAVYRALEVEARSVPTDRGTVSLTLDGGALLLKISTRDAASLRASLNTWLRLIDEAIDVARIASRGEHI